MLIPSSTVAESPHPFLFAASFPEQSHCPSWSSQTALNLVANSGRLSFISNLSARVWTGGVRPPVELGLIFAFQVPVASHLFFQVPVFSNKFPAEMFIERQTPSCNLVVDPPRCAGPRPANLDTRQLLPRVRQNGARPPGSASRGCCQQPILLPVGAAEFRAQSSAEAICPVQHPDLDFLCLVKHPEPEALGPKKCQSKDGNRYMETG